MDNLASGFTAAIGSSTHFKRYYSMMNWIKIYNKKNEDYKNISEAVV